MHPDRLVRVMLEEKIDSLNSICAKWRNVGVGAAIQMSHGLCQGIINNPGQDFSGDSSPATLGGLMEGEVIETLNDSMRGYPIPQPVPSAMKLFCQYKNRFNDRYRVERAIIPSRPGAYTFLGQEELYVWHGPDASGRWERMA
jgi:hypothetical protein